MIGTYKTLPAGTIVWATAMQANVRFDQDVIIEITHTAGNGVFAKAKQLLFNMPGFIPTLINKGSGELSLVLDDTITPYEIPQAQFTMTYGQ